MEIMEINKFTLFHFWGVNYVNYIVINIMNKFKFAKKNLDTISVPIKLLTCPISKTIIIHTLNEMYRFSSIFV